MTDGRKKKKDGDEDRYICRTVGPLAGDSPGNREIGRLRARGAREIGGLEGPGSGLSSGLPPRTLFFTAKSKKWGPKVPMP